jgi:hypothetical protein
MQAGMQFQPGQSGNPSGAKKGPRSLAVRIRAMAEKDAIEIVKAVIEGAKLESSAGGCTSNICFPCRA